VPAPPQEESEDERGGKECDGDQGVGNGVQPDQFRRPQQAGAVGDKH